MPQENNNIEQQIIDIFNKNEPMLLSSAKEVGKIKEKVLADFKKAQIDIKEALVKDETIDEEDLEDIYIKSLEEVKKQIEYNAKLEFSALIEKYSKN
ncbi:MAG: hypothetical protein WCO35_00450 [Candidatus Nomurabacteria bacterium]